MKDIVAVDLFCGIGGLTRGLSDSGIKVVAGIDLDSSCRFAYEANNDAIFLNENIENLSGESILKYYPEDCLKALVGCAPCQPFSRYSSRYRKNGYMDDKWKLLYSFERLVQEVQPDVISMENVPSLRNQQVFRDFTSALVDMDYHIWYSVVYCPEYGVPQERKRLVLLASRLGEISLISPEFDETNFKTVRDAIAVLPVLKAGETDKSDPLHTASKLSEVNHQRIRASRPGGTWRDWDQRLRVSCHTKESGKTFPSVYGRMEWDRPSPTITTQFYGYGNGRFGHPEQDRAISLREGALLQSFPRDYIFVDSNHPLKKRELGMHIGNAVPVALGRAIGKSIYLNVKENSGD